jgi:hypothetical protein
MIRRLLLPAAAACALVAGGSGTAAAPEAAGDVRALVAGLERLHPSPYHATSREAYERAADDVASRVGSLDDDELLVELMRLVALLGERDGHAHLHPLVRHRRALHLYPLATYGFSDGTYVTGAPGRAALVGRRLVAIEGMPLEDVLSRVDRVVPSDNDVTRRAHRNAYLLCAEVLHGLGVAASPTQARFAFADGSEAVLTPVPARSYAAAMRPWYPSFVDGMPQRAKPLVASRRGSQQWLTTLDRGRVVYLAYNATRLDTWATSQRLLRLSRRPKVRRIVIDLRNNGGGDIATYPALLDVLRSRSINRPNRLVVLIGPTTFSAAVHFAVDVDRATRAVFVGERAGGSPNHYSDTGELVVLPATGYAVGIPRVYFEKQPGRSGLVFDPDVVVPLTGADFFAGRDPALARALR